MKKGFTLVEIMVVVIIVGILTAVATPKLFGLIAKARAAEVPVAAGTYVSLQNAYLGENSGIGSWTNIGYGAPGNNGQTEYFEYSGCINGTIPFANMEPDMPGWLASNRSDLNSCRTGSAWAVIIDPAGEREIEYRQIITSAECAALTSSWGDVGETVEGMCETTGELHVAGTEDKTPDKPEETPTTDDNTQPDPETPPPQQQSEQNTENPEPQQGNCDALAESMKGKGADKGNKYGWVCVSACGVFAPPGKARNAGFDTGTLQKKKDTGGTCEKVEPETPPEPESSESTPVVGDSPVVEGNPENPTQPVVGGGGGTGNGTNSFPGYQGKGTAHAYNNDNDVCLKKSGNTCEEWIEPGYAGDGQKNNAFNSSTDYCVHSNTGNTNKCDVWVHQNECTPEVKSNGKKTGFCAEGTWKSSN